MRIQYYSEYLGEVIKLPMTPEDVEELNELIINARENITAPQKTPIPTERFFDLAFSYIYQLCPNHPVHSLHRDFMSALVSALVNSEHQDVELLVLAVSYLVDHILKYDIGAIKIAYGVWEKDYGLETWWPDVESMRCYYLTYDFIRDCHLAIKGSMSGQDLVKVYLQRVHRVYVPYKDITVIPPEQYKIFTGHEFARAVNLPVFISHLQEQAARQNTFVAELFFAGHPGNSQEKIRDFIMLIRANIMLGFTNNINFHFHF